MEKIKLEILYFIINANGVKLTPILIFKGKKDGNKEKILNNC